MKRILLLLIVGLFFNSLTKADDFDILYQRLFDEYITSTPMNSPAAIQSYMDTQLADGSWATTDYDSHTFVGGWKPLVHWDNLLNMTMAYKKPGNILCGNNKLKEQIKRGLLFWYNRQNQPFSDNWFDNDIAIQSRLYKILILVKNDFSAEPDWTDVIEVGCKKYLILPANYAITNKGKLTNAVWLARNLVHNGIIRKDIATLQQGISNMSMQLAVKSINTEGVQRDNSYLVHGLQLYNSGYGNELIKEISYYMYLTRGVNLIGFSAAQVATLSNLLLKGDQWMMQSNAYDFSVTGRNISRKNNGSTGYLKSILPRMQLVDTAKSIEYQKVLDNISDPTGATPSILGNKFFYRADFMTHRAPNLYIGIKMCSNRTRGTESMNNENLLANWLPFGATTIMRTGNEYFNIFGAWDWTKIPGVTNPAIVIPFPTGKTTNVKQTSTFVGGVSDGKFGVTAMDFKNVVDPEGESVDITARKANFLFNNEMICLGAGITSTYAKAPSTTSINQSYLNGEVLVNASTVSKQEKTYSDVKSIYHDKTGYVFRTKTKVNMKTDSQSGNWYDINSGQANATVKVDIFKLWLDHGTAPSNASYEYVVLPNFTSAETTDYAYNMPVETLSNTSSLQAVTHKNLHQTGAVFYVAGTVNISPTLIVSVDKPCILLINWDVNPIEISASDPTQTQTTLNISISYANQKSEILVYTLPYSNAMGASMTKTATIKR
jgi:chondroitin AC lyase